MDVIKLPFNQIARLHSTAYYRIKNSTTYTFLGLQAFQSYFENIGKCLGKTLLNEVPLRNCKYLNYSLQLYLSYF